jgi:hypothetical protein
MHQCVWSPEVGGKKENAPRPRKSKGPIPQPPLDLGRDFNIITTLAEKKGGTRRLDRDAEEFSAFIDTMEMVDIRTNNGQFTWNNKRIITTK